LAKKFVIFPLFCKICSLHTLSLLGSTSEHTNT
jgi:hypothetical protein